MAVDRKDFGRLLAMVADERGFDLMLVEKDCWIMHAPLRGALVRGLASDYTVQKNSILK